MLLTRHDTGHRESFLHARDTFERLLELGCGAGRQRERHRRGRRDPLRRQRLARRAGRDDGSTPTWCVLLSDIAGLYDSDPRLSDEAQLLEHVDELTDDLVAAAGGTGSDVGSGGMATKIEAANMLMKAGIPMVICDGRRERVVVDAADGLPVGTSFAGGERDTGGEEALDRAGSQCRRARSSSTTARARRSCVETPRFCPRASCPWSGRSSQVMR